MIDDDSPGPPDFEFPEEDLSPDEPVTVDAGDPAAVRRRAKKLKFDKRESADFWKSVLATPTGRRELWGILQACHWSDTKFACGPNGFPQPEATWFAAGEKSIGECLFMSWLIADREGALRMLDEFDSRFPKEGV